MAHTTAGGLVALAGSGALALALQVSARGADVPFTQITHPSAGQAFLDRGGSSTMHITGRTSPGITSVDIECLRGAPGNVTAAPVATGVAVAGASFSIDAALPHLTGSPSCRLRALPGGTDVDGDVSSFSGPVVHIDRLQRLTQGSSTFDFDLTAGSGTGTVQVHSAGNCGDGSMGTVPADLGAPSDFGACAADLGPSAVAGSGGPLRVDGHVALLPYSVLTADADGSSLHLRVHVAKSGQVRWRESAPLVRCQGTNTFPPPSGQCGSVRSTGVAFTRSGTFTVDGHQLSLRDSFASTDGRKHRLHTVYGMGWTAPSTGDLGFAFPRHGPAFHGASPGQLVTGLPQRAATVMVRSDRFAAEGDPMASTRAVTWSRPSSRVAFSSGDASVFGVSYSLKVPKDGEVRLGFTDDQSALTSSTRAAGRRAVASTMPSPVIRAPGRNAVVSGAKTVVKGVVRAGVNGLPVAVSVNGHPATLSAAGAGEATYKAVLHEPPGKHTITVRARDAGGNTRSTSITVRNK
jgi:hypothetical protein